MGIKLRQSEKCLCMLNGTYMITRKATDPNTDPNVLTKGIHPDEVVEVIKTGKTKQWSFPGNRYYEYRKFEAVPMTLTFLGLDHGNYDLDNSIGWEDEEGNTYFSTQTEFHRLLEKGLMEKVVTGKWSVYSYERSNSKSTYGLCHEYGLVLVEDNFGNDVSPKV